MSPRPSPPRWTGEILPRSTERQRQTIATMSTVNPVPIDLPIFVFHDTHMAGLHFVILGEDRMAWGRNCTILQFHKYTSGASSNESDLRPTSIRTIARKLLYEQASPTEENLRLHYIVEMVLYLWKTASHHAHHGDVHAACNLPKYTKAVSTVMGMHSHRFGPIVSSPER